MSSNLWIFLLSLLKRLEKCAKISVEWQEITSSGDLLSAEVNMNNWKRMFKRVWVLAPDQVLYQEAKPIFPRDIWRIFGWTEFGFCLLNNYKRAYFFLFFRFSWTNNWPPEDTQVFSRNESTQSRALRLRWIRFYRHGKRFLKHSTKASSFTLTDLLSVFTFPC